MAVELEAVLRARACDGKVKMAARAARRTAITMRRSGHNVQAYRCQFCPSWHVGHIMSWEGVQLLAQALRSRSYPQGAHIARRAG